MSTILVTGAGALLGQGILRCLNFSEKTYRVITADPSIYGTGHALAHKSYLIPFASDSNYLAKIEAIIKEEKVDILLIGTDVELPILAEHKKYLEDKYEMTVVVSSSKVIEIANDKWLTAQFLKEHSFPYPLSALTTDSQQMQLLRERGDYPYIAKPIDGARSMGIEIVQNPQDLDRISSYKNNLVVQELLSDDEGEFTTGCVVVEGRCVAMVSLVRDLRDGNTWRAFRDGSSRYDDQIAEIAERLGAEGPVNFQYRIRNGEPVIFEINCRFSGTTPLRYMFGFNEVEAIVEHYLNDTHIVQPELKNGSVLRTFSDIFVENTVLDDFSSEGQTAHYTTKYYPFKSDS